jgi:hypothetical protein|tara:strand:- start:4868 stop:7051 length:2184 start_codon:yes stop_codon:yes gene_type:complete
MQNLQIKDRLAKLLAGENLIVEHRQVSTASFDIEQRILTLPMWVMDSSSAYDMLIGHEVGHALYTPVYELDQFVTNKDNYKNGKYSDVNYAHVNIIEDIRIERILQKKFPGFRKTFKKGYADLHDMDFFSIKDRDVDKMSFMDRVNIYFKLGNLFVIKFTDEEMDMVEYISKNVNTFDDVLDCCLKVKDFSTKNTETDSADIDISSTNNSGGDQTDNSVSDNSSSESSENNDNSENKDSEFDEDAETKNPLLNSAEESSSPATEEETSDDVTTQKAFDSKLKDLIDTNTYERTYLNIPTVKIENIVITPDIIEKECKPYESRWEEFGANEGYFKFKKESQSSVNYMIKEFQSKKSADEYARSYSSRTGILNTKTLHSYKFSQDIFKQVQVVKEGQSHGMIFILDWSGSMQDCILETTKQLLQLVWFCKKQNIPFDVYAFTNVWNKNCSNPDYDRYQKDHNKVQNASHNDIQVDPQLNMLNLISSRRSAKDFDNDCRTLFNVSYLSVNNYGYNYPPALQMSSTPLNSTIIALRQIIPEFYKTTKVDCLSTIILTDGESDYLTHYVHYDNSKISKFKPSDHNYYVSASYRCIIRDTKLGCVYPEIPSRCSYNAMDGSTNCLLQNLKDHFPNMNLIGIRLIPNREAQKFLSGYADDYNSRATWSKDKNLCIKDTPYDMLYGMATSILNKNTTIDVGDDASISKINNAIRKSLKAKNANRKMLCSFVDTIA